VVVISESTARWLFGTGAAIDRQVLVQTGQQTVASVTVVVVARDTDTGRLMFRTGHPETAFGTIYCPLAQQFDDRLLMIGRASGEMAAAIRSRSWLFAGSIQGCSPRAGPRPTCSPGDM
jgi:hypothetical protein